MSSPKCLSKELAERNPPKSYAICARPDKNCCQALCKAGYRCQNAATVKMPIGRFSRYGAKVMQYLCWKAEFKTVDLDSNECCKFCTFHVKNLVVDNSISYVKESAQGACVDTLKSVTPSVMEMAAKSLGYPGWGEWLANTGLSMYEAKEIYDETVDQDANIREFSEYVAMSKPKEEDKGWFRGMFAK